MWLGFWLAVSAQIMWGFLPIYFYVLKSFDTLTIVAWRIVLCFLTLALFIIFQRKLGQLLAIFKQPINLLWLVLCASLLVGNWLIYVYAVLIDRVLEGSLGYFIYPLINVALGLLIFKDHLNRPQKIAVGLALVTVFYLCFFYGHFPWIGFGVAFSFSFYGAIRKKLKLDPLVAFAMELLLALPVAFYLLTFVITAGGIKDGSLAWLWLLVMGPYSVISLLVFLRAIEILPLSFVGMISYVGPSLQFFCGLLLGERLDLNKFLAFILIWISLAIYTVGLFKIRKNLPAVG